MSNRSFVRGAVACSIPILLSAAAGAQGQDEASQLAEKVESLERAVSELRQQQDGAQAEASEAFDEYDQQFLDLNSLLSGLRSGKRGFLLTGYTFGGFEAADGEDSTFSAGFSPIFLWKLSDDLFVEGELEVELEGDEAEFGLEFAQMSYVINDNLTFGMGKFLNPANPFAERLHPAWINKLPDKPLAFSEYRMQASALLGAQLHGVSEIGSQKLTYAVYVSNGPSVVDDDPSGFGTLEFSNYEDLNDNKAVGGRLACFLLPELEVGYSAEFSQVTPTGSDAADADALIQSVDLNYVTDVAMGTLDVRGQWVLSSVDDVTYDPSGAQGFGPATLDNDRNGGYVQVAYRPSEFESAFLRDVEGVVRYDTVDLPAGAPEGGDRSRVTFGMNYWLSPSSVFKLALRLDDRDGGGDSDAVLFQWATGF